MLGTTLLFLKERHSMTLRKGAMPSMLCGIFFILSNNRCTGCWLQSTQIWAKQFRISQQNKLVYNVTESAGKQGIPSFTQRYFPKYSQSTGELWALNSSRVCKTDQQTRSARAIQHSLTDVQAIFCKPALKITDKTYVWRKMCFSEDVA